MAWVVRTYACDACGQSFEVMRDRNDGPPSSCKVCDAELETDAEPIPSRIAIGGSAIARSSDLTYRQLEQSSAARAAELDAPHLKITDMKDGLREGDVAAKGPPDNVISRFDREARANGRQPITGWGGGYATPGVRVAPVLPGGTPGAAFAGPGHMALAAAQPEHGQRVAEITARTPYAPYSAGVGAKLPKAR